MLINTERAEDVKWLKSRLQDASYTHWLAAHGIYQIAQDCSDGLDEWYVQTFGVNLSEDDRDFMFSGISLDAETVTVIGHPAQPYGVIRTMDGPDGRSYATIGKPGDAAVAYALPEDSRGQPDQVTRAPTKELEPAKVEYADRERQMLDRMTEACIAHAAQAHAYAQHNLVSNSQFVPPEKRLEPPEEQTQSAFPPGLDGVVSSLSDKAMRRQRLACEQSQSYSPNRTLAHTAIAEATGVPVETLPRCSIEALPVFTVGFNEEHGGTYACLKVSRCNTPDKIDRLRVEVESRYPEWNGRNFEVCGDGQVVCVEKL